MLRRLPRLVLRKVLHETLNYLNHVMDYDGRTKYQLYGCQMLPTFSKRIPVIEVASHVKGQHIVGKVLSVETGFCWFGQFDFAIWTSHLGHLLRTFLLGLTCKSKESSRAVCQVTYSCNSGASKVLRCRHVIQATGFDSYSGAPRMLGVPKDCALSKHVQTANWGGRVGTCVICQSYLFQAAANQEVHTSQMDKVVEKLFCKRCLLVGSGKSSIDAAKLLIEQKNSVRCIYRSATAYMRFGFNSPMARLIQYFDPGRHFSILEQMPEDWKYDYSVDLKTWDWYVVGDPRSCQQVLQKTRGGIIPLSDLVVDLA